MNRLLSITARFALTLLLAVIGGLFMLMARQLNSDPARVAQDRIYLAQFRHVAAQVETYRARFHHLPADAEIAGFGVPDGAVPIQLATPLLSPEAIAASGDEPPPDFVKTTPAGGFTLRSWRGEWSEYYASWSGETTLLTTPARYRDAFRAGSVVDLIQKIAMLLLAWAVSPHRIRRNAGLSKPLDSR